MKRRLSLVFLTLTASFAVAAADVDSRDPGKLKLASTRLLQIVQLELLALRFQRYAFSG